MKKFIKIALLMLLVLTSVFVMVACDDEGDGEPVINGTITVKDAPQVQFVQGEELDLSNGVLEVKIGDTTTEVALNAEGVTVTGYDKNVLGTQTVTVSYQGYTTQLAVTVVARMVTEDAVTEYLVGDSFDVSKGRVRITRNDGTTYTAIFNSDKVTVTGFDSSKTGEQTLTVTYKNGDANYTCELPVSVYAVDSVTLTEPTKVEYKSHDTAINLKGGLLTLKGKNGTLVREVELTEDMISGFDPSAVTEKNSPLKQTVTVTYNKGSYPFEISLTYTDISSFKDNAVAFMALDWSDPELSFSKTMGATALELMELYMDFSPAEQDYITEEERVSVARAAFLYGLTAVREEESLLSGAFVVDSNGLYLVCENRSDVQSAIVRLSKEDNVLYTISPVLTAMQEAFGGDILTENDETTTYFQDALIVPVEYYEILLGVFEHMIDVADALNSIPEDWATQGIANYSSKIETLYGLIKGNEAEMADWTEIYYYISAWRTNDDMFDLLYQHYYAQKNTDVLNDLAGIRFPTGLEGVVDSLLSVMNAMDSISFDTTLFFYYYADAIAQAEAVKASGDQMLIDLYNTLPVNGLMGFDESVSFTIDVMLEYVRTTDGGYYSNCSGLLGVPAFHELMDLYIQILSKEYISSEEYGLDVQKLLDCYVALTPGQQFSLLVVINPYYGYDMPLLAFDANVELEGQSYDLTCIFVSLLDDYFMGLFSSDDAKSAYTDLMIAMEIYAKRDNYEGWYDEVTTRLNNVKSAYEAMNATDKAAFDEHLKAAYDKCVSNLAYYDAGAAITTPDGLKDALGDWEDDFLALQDALTYAEIAYYYEAQAGTAMHSMFLMGYERAVAIYNRILTEAPDEIKAMLYHYDIFGKIGETETTEYTYNSFDYSMNLMRAVYINYLQTAVGGSIYDLYVDSDLQSFMEKAYDVLAEDLDKETLHSVMAAFRELSTEEQMLFITLDGTMDGGTAPYTSAITSFLFETAVDPDDAENLIYVNYTEDAANVAEVLLYVELYTIAYQYYDTLGLSSEYLTMVADYIDGLLYGMEATEDQEAFEGLVAMYTALEGEDKTSFADFEEMYKYYLDFWQEILGTTVAA